MNDATATVTLTREQVLDELEFLATVEHALVVEYLSVCCALGHDLSAAEGGATSPQGQEAAAVASRLAQSEMFHLAPIARVLVRAGRAPELGRASSISSSSGAQIPLDPPTVEQLRHLLERETEIGTAVDWHYAQLRTSVTPAVFVEAGLLDALSEVVEAGTTHAEGAASLGDALGDPPPPDFLRVPRRETSDTLEQRLMDVSDRAYRLVTTALRSNYNEPDAFGYRTLATTAMDALEASNRALAQRGLLPAFTL